MNVAYDKNKKSTLCLRNWGSYKKRFLDNGNALHKKKSWFPKVNTIYYIKKSNEELPPKKRKEMENRLIFILRPEYNSKVAEKMPS